MCNKGNEVGKGLFLGDMSEKGEKYQLEEDVGVGGARERNSDSDRFAVPCVCVCVYDGRLTKDLLASHFSLVQPS